jgi:hypothetical protein
MFRFTGSVYRNQPDCNRFLSPPSNPAKSLKWDRLQLPQSDNKQFTIQG